MQQARRRRRWRCGRVRPPSARAGTARTQEHVHEDFRDDRAERAGRLSHLGIALRVRFERVSAQADSDETISVGRAAVQATPSDHPQQTVMLSNLGAALQVRFERVGIQADSDEAINVLRGAVQATSSDTAFQLAGYPHVVGTLWEIDDALAVRVADTFYAALAAGGNTIDTRGAAQALHHAVHAIRDELPATSSLWAAYLHAGA